MGKYSNRIVDEVYGTMNQHGWDKEDRLDYIKDIISDMNGILDDISQMEEKEEE